MRSFFLTPHPSPSHSELWSCNVVFPMKTQELVSHIAFSSDIGSRNLKCSSSCYAMQMIFTLTAVSKSSASWQTFQPSLSSSPRGDWWPSLACCPACWPAGCSDSSLCTRARYSEWHSKIQVSSLGGKCLEKLLIMPKSSNARGLLNRGHLFSYPGGSCQILPKSPFSFHLWPDWLFIPWRENDC